MHKESKTGRPIADYLRSNKKYVGGLIALTKHFSPNEVSNEYSYPKSLTIKYLTKAFFASPILTLMYLLETLIVRSINIGVKKLDPLDDSFSSTKNLFASSSSRLKN